MDMTAAGGSWSPGGLPPARAKTTTNLKPVNRGGGSLPTRTARSLSARHDPIQQLLPLAAPRPPQNQALLSECLLAVVNEYASGRVMKRKHLFGMTHTTAEAVAKNRDKKAPTPAWTDAQCRTAFEELMEAGHAVGSTRQGYMAIATWDNFMECRALRIQLLNDLKKKIWLLYVNTRRKLGPPPPKYKLQEETLFDVAEAAQS